MLRSRLIIAFFIILFSCGIHQKEQTKLVQNNDSNFSLLDSICFKETESLSYESENLNWKFSILAVCSEDSLIEEGEIFEPRVLKISRSKSDGGSIEEIYNETALTPYGAHGFPLIDRDQYIYFEKDTLIIADHGGKLTYRWFLWHKFILDAEKNWSYFKSEIEQFNPLADSLVYNYKTLLSDSVIHLNEFEAKPVFEYLKE